VTAAGFVYHARPADMRGTTLFPLNELERRHPDLYRRARAKYAGREALLEYRIPILDVLWNDALHLAPIHPARLAAAWSAKGLTSPAWDQDFFQVPVHRIAGRPSVWFAHEAYGSLADADPGLPGEDFSLFDPDRYAELAEPPSAYLDHLRSRKETGRAPRPFAFVPHVLVAGAIDVGGVALVRAR
jgi:hypothetical protein